MDKFVGPFTEADIQLCKDSILNENFEDPTGWEVFLKFPGVTAMRKAVPGKSVYLYKSVSVVEVDSKDFLECYLDLTYRKSWDDTALEVADLGLQDEGNDVIYWMVKFPWPMSSRDYVYNRLVRSFTEENLHLICARAVSLGQHKPEVKGTVRIDEYMSITAVRSKGPGQTEVLCLYYDDPKGTIPKTVVNFVTKTGFPKMFSSFTSAVEKYEVYKQQQQQKNQDGKHQN
eukprot:c11173_g1_i1.p1 GENE.c11173_g1_i1~~c11173_g1_i1.p1  ORF type:complete len:246 (-),score=71.29 c11173_g1_i1:279-968(-)